jgi:hypothetical protein
MLREHVPGFRTTCLVVGVIEVLLAASILVRGVEPSLRQFEVPADVLAAPHFHDAILWVYTHMVVFGALTVALGWLVTEARLQRWCARLLALFNVVYFVLDARTADWALGNALYRGAASVIPAIICVGFTLAFAITSVRAPRSTPRA